MNLLGVLESGLFALGQVLRFPVMLLLWVCVVYVCFLAGECLVDFWSRRKQRSGFDVRVWLRGGNALAADRERELPLSLRDFLQGLRTRYDRQGLSHGGLEHEVLEAEEKLRHGLVPSRMLVKVAPSLGLLGTLIPMGVSLASMAAGNLEAMAGQMVVAFTTTIIGLACGTGAYMINLVRHKWVAEQIREQRFIAERVALELEMEMGMEDVRP